MLVAIGKEIVCFIKMLSVLRITPAVTLTEKTKQGNRSRSDISLGQLALISSREPSVFLLISKPASVSDSYLYYLIQRKYPFQDISLWHIIDSGFVRCKAKKLALLIANSHPIYQFGDFVYFVALYAVGLFGLFGEEDFVDVVHLKFT